MKLTEIRSESMLHNFDVILCDYACGNVGAHLTCTDDNARPMNTWFDTVMGQHPVLDYIRSDRSPRLLLHATELEALALTLEAVPLDFYRQWQPWPSLHRRYSTCLAEIRQGLASTVAEAFAQTSVQIAPQLERQPLELVQPDKVFQPSVRDLGVRQIERLERGSTSDVCQPRVRDLRSRQA